MAEDRARSRHSLTAVPKQTGPKPTTNLSSSTIIDTAASIVGTHLVTIGANTVIHPRCKIVSLHAPVTIGENCILSERAVIGLPERQGDQEDSEGEEDEVQRMGVVIEDFVTIEPGVVVEARRVRRGAVVQVLSRLGRRSELGQYCMLGPGTIVAAGERVPERMTTYGRDGKERRIDRAPDTVIEIREKGQKAHVDALRKLIPSNLAKWQ
jgi:dynactin-6